MQHSKSLVEDYLDSIFIKFSFNLSANICPVSTGRIIYDCNRFVFKTCENKQFEEVKLRSVEQ